jgi:hypothetical protein
MRRRIRIVDWLLLVPVFAALLWLFGPSRYDAGFGWGYGTSDTPDDGPPGLGGVREPRRPPPGTDMAGAAVDPRDQT